MDGGARSRPICRGQHLRQDPEQLVVPVARSIDDGRMVVLQESPHLAEHREIGDLDLGQVFHRDSGSGVELVVQIQDGLGSFNPRNGLDRPAVQQQAKVIDPDPSGARGQDPERQLRCCRVERQHDRVFRPLGRALQLAALHVVERNRSAIVFLPHRQAREVGHVFRAKEAVQLELRAREVDGDRFREGGERARTVILPFDPGSPPPTVHRLSIHGKRPGRAAIPTRRHASGVLRLEVEDANELGTDHWRLRRDGQRIHEKRRQQAWDGHEDPRHAAIVPFFCGASRRHMARGQACIKLRRMRVLLMFVGRFLLLLAPSFRAATASQRPVGRRNQPAGGDPRCRGKARPSCHRRVVWHHRYPRAGRQGSGARQHRDRGTIGPFLDRWSARESDVRRHVVGRRRDDQR